MPKQEQEEEVVPIDLGVQWDMGAPMPCVIHSDIKTFLAFYLDEPDPEWDGTYVSVADPASSKPTPVGIIEWLHCESAILGGLNDEVIRGHRLHQKGLSRIGYGAAEVRNSAWISELMQGNSVHSLYDPDAWKSAKHYILIFHDSTFECIADGYRVEKVYKPMREVLLNLAQRLID